MIALLSVLGLVLFAPASALAGSRAFLRQITGTPTGPGGAEVAFNKPGGVVVDGSGNVWVTDALESEAGFLDGFNGSGGFVGRVELEDGQTIPGDLAFEDSTGHFYVTGEGTWNANPAYVEVFGDAGEHLAAAGVFGSQRFDRPHVAVDNATGDPFDGAAGSVYVTQNSGASSGIEKFNAKGEPVEFGGAKQCEIDKCGYIKGSEITGIPAEPFHNGANQEAPTAIAVDDEGNIYALDRTYNKEGSGKPGGAVVEFNPEGVFVRAFTGEENPGLGANHSGWGASASALTGVAVDPQTGDVLVSIHNTGSSEGAVDVFEPAGHYVEQITEAKRGTPLQGATEMAFDSGGELYVVEPHKKAVEVYGIHHVLPALKLAEASGLERTEAVLSGTVDPEGEELSACDFEYVTAAAYEKEEFAHPETAACVPGAHEITASTEPQPVHADVGGLTSGTTYYYRLSATTAGSSGGSARTEALAFTAPHAPRIDSSSVTNVSSQFAELHARIAPLGAATSYHFEYGAGGEGWRSAPVPDAEIGAGGPDGGADVNVLQQIGPLRSGTVYTVRVLATNVVEGQTETTVGGEVSFVTLPASGEGLPDGRVYELVTPPNKGSAEDMFSTKEGEPNTHPNNDDGYPSESGEEFLLETKAAFGTFAASADNVYVFRRDAEVNSWQTLPLASPSLGARERRGGPLRPVELLSGRHRCGVRVFDQPGRRSPAQPARTARQRPLQRGCSG